MLGLFPQQLPNAPHPASPCNTTSPAPPSLYLAGGAMRDVRLLLPRGIMTTARASILQARPFAPVSLPSSLGSDKRLFFSFRSAQNPFPLPQGHQQATPPRFNGACVCFNDATIIAPLPTDVVTCVTPFARETGGMCHHPLEWIYGYVYRGWWMGGLNRRRGLTSPSTMGMGRTTP